MLYSAWGGKGPMVSRLGFGCLRFPKDWLQERKGILNCVKLVEYAIDKGINYFDVAPTYANGLAETILGEAFHHSNSTIYVAGKSGLIIDQTGDELLKRLDTSLKLLHRDQIDFYHIWSVMNWAEYQKIMKPGGLYEGAVKARNLGLIRHLCISLHCDAPDVLKIIQEGYFDGITISMNAMNYGKWLTVLHAAKEKNMGVATMNSLGGGIIPQYRTLFGGLDTSDNSTPMKALRFLASFPDIDVILSGMTSKEQIDENCSPFMESISSYDGVNPTFKIDVKENLCSGCNYCAPCSVKLPISACMQAYNQKIFAESAGDSLCEQRVANGVFISLRANGVGLTSFESCIACRKCEHRCTQKINIVERLKQMAKWAKLYGYTAQAIDSRLHKLEKQCCSYQKIAIWPSCYYADKVLDYWQNRAFEERCEYFNSNPKVWGKQFRNKTIHGPSDIESIGIEAIVIMNYRFQDSIWEDLRFKVPQNVEIIKLHQENDVNWFEYNE